MAAHRVLLVSTHPLLSEGLQHVLGSIHDLTLIGPLALEHFDLDSLSWHAPDVVLFAGEDDDDPAVGALVLSILQHVPEMPVIQVGLSGHNVVRVYTSHTLPARSADLIDTIRALRARTEWGGGLEQDGMRGENDG
jgi:DNA-binding NarL/FixJ family response regulator